MVIKQALKMMGVDPSIVKVTKVKMDGQVYTAVLIKDEERG